MMRVLTVARSPSTASPVYWIRSPAYCSSLEANARSSRSPRSRANSCRSSAVRRSQWGPRARRALSVKSKTSVATRRMAARRSLSLASPFRVGSSRIGMILSMEPFSCSVGVTAQAGATERINSPARESEKWETGIIRFPPFWIFLPGIRRDSRTASARLAGRLFQCSTERAEVGGRVDSPCPPAYTPPVTAEGGGSGAAGARGAGGARGHERAGERGGLLLVLIERRPEAGERAVAPGEADPGDGEGVHEPQVELVRGVAAATHAGGRLLGQAQQMPERAHVLGHEGLVAKVARHLGEAGEEFVDGHGPARGPVLDVLREADLQRHDGMIARGFGAGQAQG